MIILWEDGRRKNFMRQTKFLEELKEYISKTAYQKNPQITANSIYFMIKQYPAITTNQRSYIKILKKVKKMLLNDFEWRIVEIHKCFCILNKLTSNIKNNT